MEHDRIAEALAIAVNAGLRLDLLDLGVHRLAQCICCLQHNRVDDAVQIFLDHLRRTDHWFKFATLRPTDPLLLCATHQRFADVVPQLRRRFFQSPCARGVQCRVNQLLQQHASPTLHSVCFLQPHKLRLRKCCITSGKKFAVLIFAHGIHRVAKMFGNMESIKRDLCDGQVLLHRVDVRGSHVHRGNGDR